MKLFDSRRQREDPEQPPPQPLPPEQVPAYRLYSERQVLLTTALFSPLAGGVLLWANLRKLGQRGRAWLALLYGPAFTACLIGLAVVMSKVKGLPTGWLLEGISIGATHLLFKSWIQEGLRAHLAAGGKIASHLRALGAAIFGAAGITALLFAGFMGALLFGPTSLYDSFAHCVTFSRTYTVAREEVCYRHGASEAEARAVGTALQKEKFFNGRRLAMVARLERSAEKLVLSLQLDEEMLRAEDARRYFDDLARSVAAAVTPGKPFELHLCDEDWNVRATLPERR